MRSLTTTTRRAALALSLALTLGACGGGEAADPVVDGDPSASEVSTDPAAIELAVLNLVDPAAEFRTDVAPDFTSAEDGQPLDDGDTVRTDVSGFAIIDYVDGSVTRLDVLTEYRVVSLAGTAEAPEVRARLDIGRAWHNNQEAAADGSFVVETPVGTAAVRGTIWLIECLVRTICTFSVVEGQVAVTPTGGEEILLNAGEQITVTVDGVEGDGAPVPAEAMAPGRDQFTDRNRTLDLGEPDPGGDSSAATTPTVRLIQPLGDLLLVGDVVPLSWITDGVIESHEGQCDGVAHLHAGPPTYSGIFVRGLGPFPEEPNECGFGVTSHAIEIGGIGG